MTKSSTVLSAILVLALALRLGMGLFLGFNAPPDQAACGADTVEFEHMAWSAAQGNGFTLYDGGPPTAFRAPGYPMLLAVVYKLFGRTYWINRVVLSLLGAGTCWLVYLLALRLKLDRTAALLAAFLTSVLPLQFYWCGHFMSEPLSAFLNVAVCLLLVMAFPHSHTPTTPPPHTHAPTHPRTPILLLAGLVGGFAVLVRAASVLLPVILAGLWMLSRRVGLRRMIPWGAVFVAGMAIVILPWAIRNKIVLDRFALVSTNGGSTFWGANNAIVAGPGKYWGDWISTSHVDRALKEREVWPLTNEIDRDRKEWELGKQWVFQHPAKLPLLLAGKFYRLVRPWADSPNRVYVLVVGLGWILLLPLSILGMGQVLLNREARARFIPLHAQLLTLLATTAIFYGSERFRAPYEPLLAVYAAVAVVWGIEIAAKRLKTHKRKN